MARVRIGEGLGVEEIDSTIPLLALTQLNVTRQANSDAQALGLEPGAYTGLAEGFYIDPLDETRERFWSGTEWDTETYPRSTKTVFATPRRPAIEITLRVWDGPQVGLVIPDGGSPLIENVRALAAEVVRSNILWPMSTSRASTARTQVSAGYVRDACLLGDRGLEEFWSDLSDAHAEWAEIWRESTMGHRWPIAVLVSNPPKPQMTVLTDEALVVVDGTGITDEVTYSDLGPPDVSIDDNVKSSDSTLEGDDRVTLLVAARSRQDIVALPGLRIQDAQNLARFLLLRWAEYEANRFENAVDAIEWGASELTEGRMLPMAYAAFVDAVIAQETQAHRPCTFPPIERPYLRTVTPQPSQGHATQSPRPASTARPSAGVNVRAVASGAAVGAALWGMLTD